MFLRACLSSKMHDCFYAPLFLANPLHLIKLYNTSQYSTASPWALINYLPFLSPWNELKGFVSNGGVVCYPGYSCQTLLRSELDHESNKLQFAPLWKVGSVTKSWPRWHKRNTRRAASRIVNQCLTFPPLLLHDKQYNLPFYKLRSLADWSGSCFQP